MPGGESIRIADGVVLATKGAGVSESSPVALGDPGASGDCTFGYGAKPQG